MEDGVNTPGIISYGCGRIIPGSVEYDAFALPDQKPRLVFIDTAIPGAFDLLKSAIMKRIAVALCGVGNDNLHRILALSSSSHRNQAPVAILGSWRYIPAVAAVKEIVNTGCIGSKLTIKASEVDNDFNAFRLNDIAKWLGAQFIEGVLQSTLGMVLEITGENGWIKADFTLDGRQADFHACISGHERQRMIPAANPFASELAVLGMSLPKDGRIKTLPMMMTI